MKNLSQFFNKHRFFGYLIIVVISLLIGWAIWGRGSQKNGQMNFDHNHKSGNSLKQEVWTCSMHPQIRLPKPGKCPICGMDLVPAVTAEKVISDNQIELSENALKLAEIETTPVLRKAVTMSIRLTGKVAYDETLVRSITSRVSGRIDKMYIDFSGVKVRKGEKLVLLYSPELLSAQKELLGAYSLMSSFGKDENSESARSARKTFESSRKKLLLLGITEEQIDELLAGKNISEQLAIHSSIDGIVLEKNRLEGEYVEAGTEIYKVADLSKVWVVLDAYEPDVSFLKINDEVRFTTESYADSQFKGMISFIDPVLDEKTRTVGVRVNVQNPDRKLKPGMFVRADIDLIKEGGNKRIVHKEVYKWTCPMHPEVIKSSPGNCPICGMTLEKTKITVPIVSSPSPDLYLLIPASAPLITGKRAVVYVKIKNNLFEGREIELGQKAGDYYIVKSGLKEGEDIVVRGNFKIDSAMQIKAKHSMMNDEIETQKARRH